MQVHNQNSEEATMYPRETEEQRAEREKTEKKEKKAFRIAELKKKISELESELASLEI